MGRMITVPIRRIALPTSDADFDIFEIATSSNFRGALHMVSLQSDATADEWLDLAFVRRSGAGTGGTAITEITDDQGNTRTPSFAAVRMVTAPGTLTTTLAPHLWNLKNDLLYIPTPECREIISESAWFCLNCLTSLSVAKNVSGFMKIEEF